MSGESTTSSEPAGTADALPRIRGYRIERRLGQGGMASVYLALQESLDREVAIKVMYPDADPEQALRFEQEARMIARLEHPHIVGVHEVGHTEDGRLCFVMPYLSGGDLGQRDLSSDPPRVIVVLRALLEALSYAHARGVVHRDVKPENVLFDSAGRPRLADFGIARARNVSMRITGAGLTIGSGGFMAPEQARGEDVDGRADLYAVGVLAYELLTGELPFRSSDGLTLALMHAHDPVPRLPRGLGHWQPFIDRAMAKQPERRFKNAQAMLRALEQVERRAEGGFSPQLLLYALGHGRARQLALLAAAAALTVALVLALRPSALPPAADAAAVAGPETAPSATEQIAGGARARALALAQRQFDTGAIVRPTGANAAETWIEVLQLSPDDPEAARGLGQVLNWLADDAAAAIAAGAPERAETRYEQARLIADSAGPVLDRDFLRFHARVEAALGALAGDGADGPWDPLRRQLERRAPEPPTAPALATAATAAAPAPAPAEPVAPAQMVVTRSDYDRFVRATGREPSRCHFALSLLRLVDEKDWRDPGFPQQAADPVVCVSYEDALAYARWRSQRDGRSWRLPLASEQPPPAGRFGTWTGSCSSGCDRRIAVGADDGQRALAPDRGYNRIGIRLVAPGS